MRDTISCLQDAIDMLRTKKREVVRAYLEEHTNWLYITDHAIVRYLERIKGIQLNGTTDQEKLKDIDTDSIRKEMLSKDEQKKILLHDIEYYKRSDIRFIIKGVAVVTVFKEKRK